MTTENIVRFLNGFKWENLRKMYGCAHSSIIGFISSEWIGQSQHNTVLDGAPSSETGTGRGGQRHADIILCKQEKPYIVVEVESGVSKYGKKIDSIQRYFRNKKFDGLNFGLLIMTNMYDGKKCKHNWDQIKKIKETMVFVSIEKKKEDKPLCKLRKGDYSPWSIKKIDYRIYTTPTKYKPGNLYKSNEK